MRECVKDSAALLVVLLRFNTTLLLCKCLHRRQGEQASWQNQHRSQSVSSLLLYKFMCDSGASQQNSVEASTSRTEVQNIQLVQCNPSLQKPSDPKLILKQVFFFFLHHFWNKVLACTVSKLGAKALEGSK